VDVCWQVLHRLRDRRLWRTLAPAWLRPPVLLNRIPKELDERKHDYKYEDQDLLK